MVIKVDTERQTIEIRGIVYSLEVFAALGEGGVDIGTKFRLVERADRVVTIERLKES